MLALTGIGSLMNIALDVHEMFGAANKRESEAVSKLEQTRKRGELTSMLSPADQALGEVHKLKLGEVEREIINLDDKYKKQKELRDRYHPSCHKKSDLYYYESCQITHR